MSSRPQALQAGTAFHENRLGYPVSSISLVNIFPVNSFYRFLKKVNTLNENMAMKANTIIRIWRFILTV
jgi:hypothetical protein